MEDFPDDIKKAESLKVPVVAFSFITSTISNKAREKPDAHKVCLNGYYLC